jgi:fructose-1,6-bisphosphatase/inositol monophosphatase family enzyme
MPIAHPDAIVARLIAFQKQVRDLVVASHQQVGRHEVARSSAADTIYQIDTDVDPLLERFCEAWGREQPLMLVAEGLEDAAGNEVTGGKVFPHGSDPEDAAIRVIVDPIDGTRGIMYDKRAAWALAAVAPNRGDATRLADVEIAVMTELPTSKMGSADVLWAVKGRGANGYRQDVRTGATTPLAISPSTSPKIDHGFAMVSNFFPGTKVLASELMEFLVDRLIGAADVTKATVFDDQYIATGGQFYELIVGHDRFNADLRPLFYRIQDQPPGLCCHPYDCGGLLIAQEAGVILTDGLGNPLDGPLDTTTGLSWAGFANRTLHERIQPLLNEFLSPRLR